jgi:hypothetical protein
MRMSGGLLLDGRLEDEVKKSGMVSSDILRESSKGGCYLLYGPICLLRSLILGVLVFLSGRRRRR